MKQKKRVESKYINVLVIGIISLEETAFLNYSHSDLTIKFLNHKYVGFHRLVDGVSININSIDCMLNFIEIDYKQYSDFQSICDIIITMPEINRVRTPKRENFLNNETPKIHLNNKEQTNLQYVLDELKILMCTNINKICKDKMLRIVDQTRTTTFFGFFSIYKKICQMADIGPFADYISGMNLNSPYLFDKIEKIKDELDPESIMETYMLLLIKDDNTDTMSVIERVNDYFFDCKIVRQISIHLYMNMYFVVENIDYRNAIEDIFTYLNKLDDPVLYYSKNEWLKYIDIFFGKLSAYISNYFEYSSGDHYLDQTFKTLYTCCQYLNLHSNHQISNDNCSLCNDIHNFINRIQNMKNNCENNQIGYDFVRTLTKRNKTDNPIFLLIEGYDLQYVNDCDKTMQMCTFAVERDANMIKYVPIKFRTDKICDLAVSSIGSTIQYVPDHLKTKQLYEKAITNHKYYNQPVLKYISPNVIDQNMCDLALSKSEFAFKYVPDKFKTLDMCISVVSECRKMIKYVPESLKTSQICNLALSDDYSMLKYMPESFKNAELCNKEVRLDASSIMYVPDQLKTIDMCKYCVSKNGQLLKYVPEYHKTEELCKIAVSNCGEASEYVPECYKSTRML